MPFVHALALALIQVSPSPADQTDAKCVIAMTLLSDGASAADKAGLDMTMGFFLGKIVGRSGNAAVGPALEAVAVEMKAGGEAGAAALAPQCAAEFGRAAGSD